MICFLISYHRGNHMQCRLLLWALATLWGFYNKPQLTVTVQSKIKTVSLHCRWIKCLLCFSLYKQTASLEIAVRPGESEVLCIDQMWISINTSFAALNSYWKLCLRCSSVVTIGHNASDMLYVLSLSHSLLSLSWLWKVSNSKYFKQKKKATLMIIF